MRADEAIASLDDALDDNGEDITLRRIISGSQVNVICRAMVRGYAPDEMIGSITQQDLRVIMSPTQINDAGWPGTVPANNDPRIPVKGDRIITSRGPLTVQAAAGIFMGETLVRIEAQARGQG